MQKIGNYFLVLVFLSALLIPTVNAVFDIWEFKRPKENRKYKDGFSLKVDKFSQEFDTYYNDNFSFRTPLLDSFHKLKFKIFGVSTYANKTIIGTNNWYFLGEKQLNVYHGKHDFNEKQLEAFDTEWNRRKEFFAEKNIPYYWVIAPNKHNLYPEELPKHLVNNRPLNRTGLLKKFMEDKHPNLIIDPTDALLAAKEDAKVYYQLDNHWNYKAGEVCAKLIREQILDDYPDIKLNQLPDYKWDTIRANWGIHHRTLGIPELFEIVVTPKFRNKPVEKYDIKIPELFALKDHYSKVYINEDSVSDLKVLIIRDSFGDQIIPFLSTLFKESIFIFDSWQLDLNEKFIEEFEPDMVIYLGLESHMENIIN